MDAPAAGESPSVCTTRNAFPFSWLVASNHYENGLAGAHAVRQRYRLPLWLAVTLVLSCLTPRIIVAVRAGCLGYDGPLYIQMGKAIEAGDLQAGLREMRLNTFPLILAGLHRLGLDWETGGMVWGICMASLTVLPLFGWLRRQFDDRVAILGSILYATHANLITTSFELLRDPTFWFLYVLAIYLLWRAVIEVRWWLFLAAGAAMLASVATRMEGLFLLLPFVLWSVWRGRYLRESRWRLAVGACAGLLAIPMLLALVNLTWLRQHNQWESFRLPSAQLVQSFLASCSQGETEPQGMSLAQKAWTFLNSLDRGINPLFGLFMLLGVVGWWRVWARSDHQPLFYVGLGMLVAIWAFLCYAKEISYRYPLPTVIMACGFAALGIMWVSQWLWQLSLRWTQSIRWQRAAALAPMAVMLTVGLGDAFSRDYSQRRLEASIGRWLRANQPEPRSVLGHRNVSFTVAHYADARRDRFGLGFTATSADVLSNAQREQPSAVVLFVQHIRSGRTEVSDGLQKLGFTLVPPATFASRRAERVLVFVKNGDQLAGRGAAQPR